MAETAGKKKGPIRLEAILPLAAVSGLTALYFTLFFDGHLRRAIEWAATRAIGAQVDIATLRIGFLDATVDLRGIEVTDASDPAFNQVAIGRIDFKLLWDALLRGKAVIERSGVNGIELRSKRRSPGRVLPPAQESFSGRLFESMKERISGSALGDITDLLEGMDPMKKLKDVGDLKALAKVNALQADLLRKEQEWKASLAKIPGQKDFAELQQKISSITAGGNPAELAAKAGQLKSLIGEAEAKIGSVQSLSGGLVNDIQGFSGSVGQIDQLVAQDRSDLEKRLKIPSVDPKSLAMNFFGRSALDKVKKVENYAGAARQYMPEKPVQAAKPKPSPRARGRNYEFPVTTGYPSFWLKRAEISSKGENSALGGDVRGELLDASSNMAQTGRPAVLKLDGDFPKLGIRGISLKATADHRTSDPFDSVQVRVASYPVPRTPFSESESLRFGFDKAAGTSSLDASLQGGKVTLLSENTFRDPDYFLDAKNAILKGVFESVAKELKAIRVNVKASGRWEDLAFSIDSNLADAVGRGLERQLQAKLAEARRQLETMIRAKIDGPRKELEGKLSSVKGQLTSQIDERRKQAEALKSQGQQKLTQLTQQAAPQKQMLEGLKKKLPF